jgi:hypothetical protein
LSDGANLPLVGRMRRLSLVAAICVWTGACVGTVKEGMAELEGKPIGHAIERIGPPTDERNVAGTKVYIWSGAVRGKKCEIRARMDKDVISVFEYEGDEGLCQRYAAKLKPYRF